MITFYIIWTALCVIVFILQLIMLILDFSWINVLKHISITAVLGIMWLIMSIMMLFILERYYS